jgi:iron complex outermembrane receptor protein
VGGPPLVPFTPNTPVTPVDPLKFDRTNFKAGVEYDLAEQSMLFLTYSTGFKAGGFVQTLACGADTFKPEEVRAWTLGSRNRFGGNRVQLNAEVFYWDYVDQQIAYVGVDQCGGTTFLTRNPGNATIQGANFDLTVQATSADTVRLALEYNDATYDTFTLRQQGLGAYAPAGGTRCSSTAVVGTASFDINCAGQRLGRTPEWAGTAGYEHAFDFSSGAQLTVGADMQYASERWLDFNYLPNGEADSYQVFNVQVGYRDSNDRWSITAYINNIDDEVVYTSGSSVPQLAPNGYRMYAANVMAPRMYGLRAKVNF